MKTINKTTFLRRMISGKAYYSNRMSEMDRKCAYYQERILKIPMVRNRNIQWRNSIFH